MQRRHTCDISAVAHEDIDLRLLVLTLTSLWRVWRWSTVETLNSRRGRVIFLLRPLESHNAAAGSRRITVTPCLWWTRITRNHRSHPAELAQKRWRKWLKRMSYCLSAFGSTGVKMDVLIIFLSSTRSHFPLWGAVMSLENASPSLTREESRLREEWACNTKAGTFKRASHKARPLEWLTFCRSKKMKRNILVGSSVCFVKFHMRRFPSCASNPCKRTSNTSDSRYHVGELGSNQSRSTPGRESVCLLSSVSQNKTTCLKRSDHVLIYRFYDWWCFELRDSTLKAAHDYGNANKLMHREY